MKKFRENTEKAMEIFFFITWLSTEFQIIRIIFQCFDAIFTEEK